MSAIVLPAFSYIDANLVRHLRDGREAFPAMLEAIRGATNEVLLEMYWVGDDPAGIEFRDELAACARRGVVVRVVYDAMGSLGLWRSWWAPLQEAGGEVLVYEPVAPWRRRFRFLHWFFRDHRKLLIVDGYVGFTGGINLARPWLALQEGGFDWRDDMIEIRGPAVHAMRHVFAFAWVRSGGGALTPPAVASRSGSRRLSVLANRVGTKPNRRVRREYLRAIKQAEHSIDIANSYFLPGPLFLLALRDACRRGVRVRLLIPRWGDVWLVSLATSHLVGRLIEEGVEVYAFGPRMLHAKTAVLDRHFVMIGSHNLDTLSWRYNLECNVAVDDVSFAAVVAASFERDIEDCERIELLTWRARPLTERLLGWLAAKFRLFL